MLCMDLAKACHPEKSGFRAGLRILSHNGKMSNRIMGPVCQRRTKKRKSGKVPAIQAIRVILWVRYELE